MTEPGTPEFTAGPAQPVMADPRLDPPMTVRCESWERRYDPTARRAIKVADIPDWNWAQVSGKNIVHTSIDGGGCLLRDGDVHSWPVVHPLSYSVAFRHTQTREALERHPLLTLDGDMDVEAFKG